MPPSWLIRRGAALGGGLRRLGAGGARAVRGLRAAFARQPPATRRLVGAVVVVALASGAFAGVVLPLFQVGESGPPSAELSGRLPDSAVAARSITLDVAIDNVGGRGIDPVCVRADFGRPVRVDDVVFQGLDHVPMRNGVACAGKLTGQETINVTLTMVPASAGALSVELRPAEGSRVIGRGIHGTMTVTPG